MTGIKLECLGETWLCAYCSHWYFKTFPPHIFLCMSDTRSHICLCTLPSPWLTLGTFTPTCLFQASPHLAWLLLIASYCRQTIYSSIWKCLLRKKHIRRLNTLLSHSDCKAKSLMVCRSRRLSPFHHMFPPHDLVSAVDVENMCKAQHFTNSWYLWHERHRKFPCQ